MGTIKDYAHVIINTVERLAGEVYGNEWPSHAHSQHTALDADDHLHYMLCAPGVARPFTADVYMSTGLAFRGATELRFDDHYRALYTIDEPTHWTEEGIRLSWSPAEWATFWGNFGMTSIIAAINTTFALGGGGSSDFQFVKMDGGTEWDDWCVLYQGAGIALSDGAHGVSIAATPYTDGTGISISSFQVSNTGVLSITKDTTATGAITFAGGGVVQSGSTFTISGYSSGDFDHGGLSGLTDDDHTQYILAAGTRAFTGDQSMGGNQLTHVGLLDSMNQSVDHVLHALFGYEYTGGAYGIRILGESATLTSEVLVTEDAGIDILSTASGVSNGITLGAANLSFYNKYLHDSASWRAEGYMDFADSVTEVDAAYALAGDTSASLLGLILAAAAVGGGGTLDTWYDYGGAGAGAIIYTDAGPLVLNSGTVASPCLSVNQTQAGFNYAASGAVCTITNAGIWDDSDGNKAQVDMVFTGASGNQDDDALGFSLGHCLWTEGDAITIGRGTVTPNFESQAFYRARTIYHLATGNPYINESGMFIRDEYNGTEAYVRLRATMALSTPYGLTGTSISLLCQDIISIASTDSYVDFVDTGLQNVLNQSFGSPATADITSGVITWDTNDGPFQNVATGANVTNVKITPPPGCCTSVLRVTATGDRTITNFTKADGSTPCVTWKGDIDPDAAPLTIPSTTTATFFLMYDLGLDAYEGWVSLDV